MLKAGPIKVVHVASGDLWAGAEVQLFTLATALYRRTDVDITVILMNSGTLEQKLHDAGVAVYVIDESSLNGFQILYQLTRKLCEIKPHVVHTHRIKENIIGSLAARLCGDIPSIRTAHGASEHRPAWFNLPKRLILFLDRFFGRHLQRKIISVSEDLAGILQKNFPAERITVIENGIDISSFPASQSQNEARMPQQNSLCRIGIAGRLVPVKRVDIFIQAAAEIIKCHPDLNTCFHIFGDGPLRSELEALCAKLELKQVVNFEGHCENMQRALSELDIVLITSDHEGLPMILLEAMALRTAIIAHAIGGVTALLNQGECGVLVSDHRPAAYAKAIYDLCTNPVNRARLINNAANRVASSYSSERNADLYCAVYRKLAL